MPTILVRLRQKSNYPMPGNQWSQIFATFLIFALDARSSADAATKLCRLRNLYSSDPSSVYDARQHITSQSFTTDNEQEDGLSYGNLPLGSP